jgi:FKBP-type peptidyl-prolyl cis-trans isomerase
LLVHWIITNPTCSCNEIEGYSFTHQNVSCWSRYSGHLRENNLLLDIHTSLKIKKERKKEKEKEKERERERKREREREREREKERTKEKERKRERERKLCELFCTCLIQ